MLNFSTKVAGDAVVLTIAGPLQARGDAEELRGLIDGLILCGVRRLVLDFGKVERIDAAGVGALVYAHCAIGRVRGHLALRNTGSGILRVLAACRLCELFDMSDSEAETPMNGLGPAERGEKTVSVESQPSLR